MIALKVYGYFLKVLFLNFFSKNLKYKIAIDSLLASHSYRIPINLNKQKAPVTYFVKSLKLLFIKEKTVYELKKSNEAMYCLNLKHAETCFKYFSILKSNETHINVIVRDNPSVALNIIDKFVILVANFFICVISIIASFFAKNSVKLALTSVELAESVFLLKTLTNYSTSYVYYFSAFEKDANWIALLLQQNHILCHKIPSSNPIKNFYSKVLADKFSFTAPFQLEEYPKLKENWVVSKFNIMPNFGSQSLLNHTIEKMGKAPEKTIGIFTRGIWLRKLRGDSFLGVGEDGAELAMLEYMKEFLSLNEVTTVYLLLHPIEKANEEQYESSKKYYVELFSNVNLKFIESNAPSYTLFNLFDVGVASVSSVVFERLYCGYKCLLAPIKLKVKLYEDTNLDNIIALDKDQFFEKLKLILSISNEDYFTRYALNEYRLNEVKEIQFN